MTLPCDQTLCGFTQKTYTLSFRYIVPVSFVGLWKTCTHTHTLKEKLLPWDLTEMLYQYGVDSQQRIFLNFIINAV